MSLRVFLSSLVALLSTSGVMPGVMLGAEKFTVSPAELSLKGNFAQIQLLVTAPAGDAGPASAADFTPQAVFVSLPS